MCGMRRERSALRVEQRVATAGMSGRASLPELQQVV